jgi:hypothetical protein
MLFTMNAFATAAEILGNRTLVFKGQVIARLTLLEQASRIAADAAPYLHPRLKQIKHR